MPAVLDLLGKTFHSWTVVARDPRPTRNSRWVCRCECGAEQIIEGSNLVRGKTKCCRDCANRARRPRGLTHDHTGQRFGMLLVVEHLGSGRWLVRCDCGEERRINGAKLRSGQRSCGCDIPTSRSGPGHPRHQGDQIAYATAHKRVAAQRGRARDHRCLICGDQATSWAYRGGSERELTEISKPGNLVKKPGSILRYSPDPADYDPLCWSCHARKDVLEARARV